MKYLLLTLLLVSLSLLPSCSKAPSYSLVATDYDGVAVEVKDVPIWVDSRNSIHIGDTYIGTEDSWTVDNNVIYLKSRDLDHLVESLIMEGYEVKDEDIHQ